MTTTFTDIYEREITSEDDKTWTIGRPTSFSFDADGLAAAEIKAQDYAPAGYTPPSRMPAWQTELNTRLATGIAITCTGDDAISAIYALDDVTLKDVEGVALGVGSGYGLPGGGGTFDYPDISSVPHTFTATQFGELFVAMRDLVLALKTQAAIMANGGDPDWPEQSATIA